MRRMVLVGIAGFAIVAVAGTTLAWAVGRPGHDRLEVEVADLAEAPIPGTQDASAVWTGEEFVVWGGGTGDQATGGVTDQGAAYTPATDTWRTLAAAPLEARERHTAVWTGEEMLIWGGTRRHHGVGDLLDGARYDPDTDAWQPMADAPRGTDRSAGQAVLVGGHVVIGAGYGPSGQEETRVLVYDLAADRWSSLQAGGPVVQLIGVGDDVALLTWSLSDDGARVLGVEVVEVADAKVTSLGRLETDGPVMTAGLLEHDGELTLVVEPTDDEPTQRYRIDADAPWAEREGAAIAGLPGPIALYAMAQHAPVLSIDSRRIVFGWAHHEPAGIDLASGSTARSAALDGRICRNGAAHAVDGERLFVWGPVGCRGEGVDEGPMLLDVTWSERRAS